MEILTTETINSASASKTWLMSQHHQLKDAQLKRIRLIAFAREPSTMDVRDVRMRESS